MAEVKVFQGRIAYSGLDEVRRVVYRVVFTRIKKTAITIENRTYVDMNYFYHKTYEIIFHNKVHNL